MIVVQKKTPCSFSHHDTSPMPGKLFERNPRMLRLQAPHCPVQQPVKIPWGLSTGRLRAAEGCEAKNQPFTSKTLSPAQKPHGFLTQNV